MVAACQPHYRPGLNRPLRRVRVQNWIHNSDQEVDSSKLSASDHFKFPFIGLPCIYYFDGNDGLCTNVDQLRQLQGNLGPESAQERR